jgi:hypothetical protein
MGGKADDPKGESSMNRCRPVGTPFLPVIDLLC